ncbi:hypothetical protein Q7P37_002373 [Cladosporium fusiforme]
MGSSTTHEDQQDGTKEPQQSLPTPVGKPAPDFINPLPEIWKDSPISITSSYFLQSLSVTLSNFDYPAAVFWGFELVLLYNHAWEKNAWHALQKCINGGRPSRISSHALLRERAEPERDEYMVLVSPLFEPNSQNAKGVICQMMYNQNGKDSEDDKKATESNTQVSKKGGNAKTNPNMEGLGMSLDDITPLDEHPFFHRFAEMIPTGLAILDHNARAVFVNQHFYQLTTHWGDDQSFKSWPQSIHPEDYDRVMTAYQEAFRGQTELRAEFRALGSDHPWRLLLLTPLGDENLEHVSLGEYGGFICSVVDITSEKSAENDQRLAAEEATERKQQQERFVDMISHEIRNPLSAMVHCVEDINDAIKDHDEKSGKIDTEPIAEALDTINLCISHQKNIVDDVLSYSKLDSSMLALTPKPSQPEKELRGNAKIFQPEFRKHNINFECRVDAPYHDLKVDWSMADLSRIGQVLINLISNAIKFTSRKSGEKKITCKISASLERPDSYPPEVVFFSSEQGVPHMDATQRPEWGTGDPLFVMVAVTDSGIGIGEEDQKKLFERFKQATPKTNEIYGGSGLGLNISRKLVQLHGGEIGVTSTEGEGATFGFFFRVRRSGPPDREEKDKEKKQQQKSARGQIRLGGLDSKEESLADRPEESRKPASQGNLQRTQSSKERENQSENLEHDLNKGIEHQKSESKDHELKDHDQNEKHRSDSENRREADQQTGEGSKIGKTGESLDPTSPSDSQASAYVTDKAPPESSKGKGKGKGSESKELSKNASNDEERKQKDKEPTFQQQPQQPTELPLRKRPDMSEPLHILLVEDNIINQKLVSRKLASKKFHVSVVKNGREAVDFVTESFRNPLRAASADGTKQPGEIDIVLMDQEMPVLDGNAAAREIREREREMGRDKRVPILGVSANVREEQLQEMMKSGMDDYITKPYSIEDMVAKFLGMIE